jgi:hypothetical protein
MDNEEVKIDYSCLMQQIIDKAIGDTIASFMPDEEGKKVATAIFAAHRRYGVDSGTTIKILMELCDILKGENE